MPQHEKKVCPRCSSHLDCKPGNITQCPCYGISLTAEQNAYIEHLYNDCLCRDCLLKLKQEVELFKEKYIFRS